MTNSLLVAGIKPKITDKWDYFDVKARAAATPTPTIEKAFGSAAAERLQDGRPLTG